MCCLNFRSSNHSQMQVFEKTCRWIQLNICKTKYFRLHSKLTLASYLSSNSDKNCCSEFDIDLLSLSNKYPVKKRKKLRYEIDKCQSDLQAGGFE